MNVFDYCIQCNRLLRDKPHIIKFLLRKKNIYYFIIYSTYCNRIARNDPHFFCIGKKFATKKIPFNMLYQS